MKITDIYQLDSKDTQQLYCIETIDGELQVLQHDNFRWLQIGGEAIQSVFDTAKPNQIQNPVNEIMLLGLCMTSATKVLNLGLGGGSYERFFRYSFPAIQLDSVESNEAVIHVAREYFSIPASWPIYHCDAESFMLTHHNKYDLVLCDIFSNQTHPDCLYQENFYQLISNCLTNNGIFCCNLTPVDESELLEILLPLREHFKHIMLYQLTDHYNFVVFAAVHDLQIDTASDIYTMLESTLQLNPGDIMTQLYPLPTPA